MFNRGKKTTERLKASFGKVKKDDAFNFKRIGKYFRNKDKSNAFHVLSDKTCNDLDFEELFKVLDRTNSKVGQQFLYNKLRTIRENPKDIKLNEEVIATLTKEADLRISVQKQLEKLQNYDVYHISALFQEKHLEPPKWFFITKLLSFTSVVSLVLFFFDPQFLLVLLGVFIVNLGIHLWNKKNLFQYLRSIPELLRLNRVASYLHTIGQFKKLDPNLRESTEVINQVKNRMSFFQLETKLNGEFEAVAWAVFELLKIQFLLEPILSFGVLKRLNTKRQEIENVFEFVGRIDTLVSIASLRSGLDTYCIPEIDDNRKLLADEIYHPLISNCVPNTIKVSDKSILLTGSNMSGKTSFIRTIGLNVLTGLTINTCFAKTLTLPMVKIFSAIRISDDLLNDKSYYFEEVLTIKEMISESNAGNASLFLLDEVFKGTNTIERIAAGKAVLSALSKNGNLVFVATHDIELTDMLSDEYELYHFSEMVDNRTVGFDYKLKEGELRTRNAIRILEINEYPDKIVREARYISEQLDKISSKTNK